VVSGRGYSALYERQTDSLYGVEAEHWHREFMCTDEDETAAKAMAAVLSHMARGRYDVIYDDELCNPGSDEPFPESLPRHVLDNYSPLHARRSELLRELAEVEGQLKKGNR
jgi:hypothetical protein